MKIKSYSVLKIPGSHPVHSFLIEISDVKSHAETMIETISDNTWLDDLDAFNKISFSAMAKPTIDRLVNGIFNRIETAVTEDFGEYMISMSAQDVLHKFKKHIKLPLAELLKEKIIGNPGFDFHTETAGKKVSFGEAKYGGKTTKYSIALTQIESFIEKGKDKMEFRAILPFLSEDAKNSFAAFNDKAFTAAFSIKGKDPFKIMDNAKKHNSTLALSKKHEVFLVGVEIS
ncbi:hypothetical protein [Aeromonas sp. MR7]|uniref:hypothetical protein n=1 Tax=Aeromonas sp. MR7 TaxID=2923419 RepID=UPI001F4ACC7E|nr:hypothetical protein [Aeromonas sp. MR7]MCH7347320.1 hypothetical protein [Aeromonas sp. MR7]